jgi:uncharacterized protein
MSAASADQSQRDALRLKVLRSLDNRVLKLTLMPTEQCNFRCTYCYEDFELGAMPQWVVDGIKALLTARAPELRRLEMHWFGGEPLMALPIISEICSHAQSLRTQHPDLSIVSSATTNGYLLSSERFIELLRLGVTTYQISLDGYGENHDRTRHRIDGLGTFSKIWENLLATRRVDEKFFIMLRVHFTPSTLPRVAELVERLNEEFGEDPRYGIFFKAISRLGGPNDDQIERSSDTWKDEAKAKLTTLVRRKDKGVVDPTANAYLCYAAEPNSFVIRSNGQLARCTVAFNDPRNQVGWIRADGTLSIDLERSRLWFEGFETLDATMLYCPLHTLKPYEPLVSITPALTGVTASS